MARTIAGELTLPDGTPLANAAIHFTAKRTEAVRILEDVSSFFTTSSTGAYSQDVESGYYAVSISYATVPGTQPRRWYLGDVWVEDGDPISLTALLALNNSAADPTDSALRQLLADAQAARDEAQAAAQEAEQYRDETASMLDSKIDESEKGEPGGVATLDSGGRVPAGQLPSYVDDVEEYADYAALPTPGEAGKIYITTDTNRQYRWGGSGYIELVASPGTTDNVPEGSSNLYHTAARVRSVALAGISFASSAAITASDTILSAFGKIQAKLNTLKGMAFLDKASQEQAEAGESDSVGMTPLRARQLVESGAATAWNVRSSGSNDSGRWAKAATYTLLGQYADLNFAYQVLGSHYSARETHAGRLFVRVKQQNPMGQAPLLDVIYEKIAGPQGPQHFQLVVTKNTESETEVELWVQNNNAHTVITSYLFKRSGGGSSTYEHFRSADYADVPPVGHAVSGVAPSGLFASIDIGGVAVDESSINNWNTAYGWGDHADAGYLTSVSWGDVEGKPAVIAAGATAEEARAAIGFDNVSPATPANGGLLVDNQKTGTGLERVLTESDLEGDAGAGQALDAISLKDAIWSWWARPGFIRHKDTAYLAFTTQNGSIGIASYDYISKQLESRILSEDFTSDDHNAGGIAVDDNGLAVFFPGRRSKSDASQIYYWESNTGRIQDLGAQKAVPTGTTQTNYPNAYHWGGSMFLLYRGRGDDGEWFVTTNTFPLAAWGAERKLFSSASRWGYFATRRSRSNAAVINFALGWHPVNEPNSDIYVGRFIGDSPTPWDIESGGNIIGNLTTGSGLPFSEAQLELVYSPAPGEGIRLLDVHDGCVVFATYTNAQLDCVYKFARKEGSSWAVSDIAPAGKPFWSGSNYYGGVAIDDADTNILYVSREDSGEWLVEEYRSGDNGATWSLYREISRSYDVAARPQAEVAAFGSNTDSGLRQLFWRGRWDDGTPSTLQFRTDALSGHGAPESTLKATHFLGVGETVAFSAIGTSINIPVDMPLQCQFVVRISATDGAAAGENPIYFRPNGNTYPDQIQNEAITARGSNLTSSQSTGGYFNLTSQAGTVFCAELTIFSNGTGDHKLMLGSIGGLWGDGSLAKREYFGRWASPAQWETIGNIEWVGGSASTAWLVSVTRVL